MKDYYQILGIPGNATPTQIRKAYYQLAHQYHPDKNPDAAHHQKFLDIKEAYETLGNKEKRQQYHYRWVNFKNNPNPVVRPAASPRATPGHGPRRPYAAQKRRPAPRNDYRTYEPFFRKICRASLLLTAILLLDLVFARELKHETALLVSEIVIPAGRVSERAIQVFTPNTQFRVAPKIAAKLFLKPGFSVDVWQTPLLKQEYKIRFLEQIYPVNGASIYRNFAFLLVLQTLASIIGLTRRISWAFRLNAGILAGVISLLTLLVVLISSFS